MTVRGIRMEKIEIFKAPELTSPNPLTMICTKRTDGTANLAPVSWFTYLSFNPPTVCFAIGTNSHSGMLIRETKKAVITVPGSGLEDAVVRCGTSTGKDTDKSKFLNLVKSPGCDIMIPKETVLAIEVSLQRYEEVGDHYLYICSVDGVYGDADRKPLFAWNGYGRIAPLGSE